MRMRIREPGLGIRDWVFGKDNQREASGEVEG
jgi:hypothetical protein